MPHHIINGRKTHIGHMVHYTDHLSQTHAALIKDITTTPAGHKADLHVFHSVNGSDNHVENVAHSSSRVPNTWMHIPE